MKNKILLTAIIGTMGMGAAQAELSSIQKQVIADHNSMDSMSAEQRRDFRKQIFGNTDKVAQRAYNQAYKAMVEANMMRELSPVTALATAKKQVTANRAVGTSIQYDSGTVEATNAGAASYSQGNKFNTAWNPTAGASGALNPVLTTGSVTAVTVSMGATAGSAAFLTIANGTATGATLVTSVSVPVAVGLNTITGLAIATNGPFLGAIWQNAGGTSGDVIAMATGTTNGQGYHGVNFNDIALTDFSDVASRNAVFRVQGQLVADTVPVELMNFSVE